MNVTGWEIKPLGWIALALVTGVAIYVVITLRNKAKAQNQNV